MKPLTFFILLLPLLFLGCLDDEPENCVTDRVEDVTSINAPVSADVINQPIDIAVNFTVNNGCGAFNRFIETANNNVRTIQVEARYSGCICTQIMMDLTSTYSFVTDQPGDYELRFKSGPESAIIVNVTIN